MDHQSNLLILEAFSQPFVRLPLRNSPHIHHGNALRMDWNDLLPAAECSYILGNPPFVGAKFLSDEQRADMRITAGSVKRFGLLDYVAAWYLKATVYIQGTAIPVGFVSTNSITQGEQIGLLWTVLLNKGIFINFAHRTFVWQSEARGKAHVHVVIIGFALHSSATKLLFDYRDDAIVPTATSPLTISPYLVEGGDIVVTNRSAPLSEAPPIYFGNQPIDGGNLLLTGTEYRELLALEPTARAYLRPFVGAVEFLHSEERWCLWLNKISPATLSKLPRLLSRVRAVEAFRKASKRQATRELAKTPTRFAFISHQEEPYLLIPSVSSLRRPYIPIAFMSSATIASNLCLIIPGANRFHFAVLTSSIHMSWVRLVAGRLKSDFRYSNTLVYNNFPWPNRPSREQQIAVEREAQAVLDVRALHSDSTLAQIYNPVLMPPELTKAHEKLDRAVERCYRPEPFTSDRERVEFLFTLYEQLTAKLTAPLLPAPTPRRRRRAV